MTYWLQEARGVAMLDFAFLALIVLFFAVALVFALSLDSLRTSITDY
jgi:hypothetical protein